jgi:hypothetical protein
MERLFNYDAAAIDLIAAMLRRPSSGSGCHRLAQSLS